MSSKIQFETPENIRVSYQLAGPGTRFVAWFVDCILLLILSIVILIVLVILGGSVESVLRSTLDESNSRNPPKIVMYIAGLFWLAWSLGSFFYFGLSELLLRGQTLGKRQMRIRVVKSDGFSLDPGSIFVRTIFRIIDQLPPLWLIPLVSHKTQRLGDLVAGTVVIADQTSGVGSVREVLANRKAAESRFQFDAGALGRARRQDIEAVERILDRWNTLSVQQREQLLRQIVPPLAARMRVEAPIDSERLQFLEDLLSAEYRRQYRKLG